MAFPFTIALCCNGSLLPGLHATLGSLTRKLGQREKVSLHLFFTDIDAASRQELEYTVTEAGGVGQFQLHEADLSAFGELESLHGERSVYLRLMLPDLLPEAPVILYLDSDLVVNTDVCEMFAFPVEQAPLGAIPSELLKYCLDLPVFQTLGLNLEEPYFNSGVLLINADHWRKIGFWKQAMEFAHANPTLLRSHDQTILNVFFSASFYKLPSRFNHQLFPMRPRLEPTNEIYHFAGSPKPWDPLGSLLHKNGQIWRDAIASTRFRWSHFLARYGKHYAARAWVLRKSYLREIRLTVMGRWRRKA